MVVLFTVVLCDDESVHLDKIRDMLETYQEQRQGCELKIECFESAETLLERFREQNYEPDLLLMDIYHQLLWNVLNKLVICVFLISSALLEFN